METASSKSLTDSLEKEIVELAIQLIDSKFSVQEALVHQKFRRAVKLLIRERRGVKVVKKRLKQ